MPVIDFPTPGENELPHVPDLCEITANEPDETEIDLTDTAAELLDLHNNVAALKLQLQQAQGNAESAELRRQALILSIPAVVEDTTTRTLGVAADHIIVLLQQLVADDDVYIDRGRDNGGVINLSNALRHIDRNGNLHIVAAEMAKAIRKLEKFHCICAHCGSEAGACLSCMGCAECIPNEPPYTKRHLCDGCWADALRDEAADRKFEESRGC